MIPVARRARQTEARWRAARYLLKRARLSLMCRMVSRLYATWKDPASSSAVITSAISKLTWTECTCILSAAACHSVTAKTTRSHRVLHIRSCT